MDWLGGAWWGSGGLVTRFGRGEGGFGLLGWEDLGGSIASDLWRLVR